MLHDIDLRRLAEMHSAGERAFVSLYLKDEAGRNSLDQRKKRIRHMLDDDAERTHFDQSLEMIESWLETSGPTDGPCCVFACWAEDLVEGHALQVELPDVLRLGPSPHIRPLAELQEEYSRFAVVVADNRRTEIYAVTAMATELVGKIRGDIKNKVKKGGWSQQRYARRREQDLHHYADEVASVLRQLVQDEQRDRIVLLGSQETLREIRNSLPADVDEKVIGEKGVDVHEGTDALIDRAYELFFEEERRSEQRHWDAIRAEYMRHGLAAVGPQDVLEAALVGRCELAIVTRNADIRAHRCRSCDNVFADAPSHCRACGGNELFDTDYVNTLTRRLELSSAEIDFVDEIPGLTKLGHVAAALRY